MYRFCSDIKPSLELLRRRYFSSSAENVLRLLWKIVAINTAVGCSDFKGFAVEALFSSHLLLFDCKHIASKV